VALSPAYPIIGVAKADGWPTALTRLRTVRDSIQLK
jgi:hypothetical protein